MDEKKGKKVTWDMGNILKTNEATSPRPLLHRKKREGYAGDIAKKRGKSLRVEALLVSRTWY